MASQQVRVVHGTERLHFRFLDTNGFQDKEKSERFTVSSSSCRQNSNLKISRGRLADYVKTLHQKAWRTIVFLYSTNQIIDLWRCC